MSQFRIGIILLLVTDHAMHCCQNGGDFKLFKGMASRLSVVSSDFVFGNESEAEAFSASSKWDTKDVTTIAQKIAQLPKVGMHGTFLKLMYHKMFPWNIMLKHHN